MKKSHKNVNKYQLVGKSNVIYCSEYKNINKSTKNINSLKMFENLLLNKHKFSLDNNFDKNHCKKFLSEKDKYLSKIIFYDEVELPSDEIEENRKYKKEINIPDGAPNKYTFGQN